MKYHKKKLITLRKLLTKADLSFSQYIRHRDHNQCFASEISKDEAAKCTGFPQCAHLIKRGKKAVRFDERNCHCSCSYHNYLHNHYPEIMTSWFIKKYGEPVYLALVLSSRRIKKWTRPELEELIKKYKLRLLNKSNETGI